MAVRVVRLGTPRAKDEGLRIGTVRRPPRGVRRDDYAAQDWYDVWFPNLAPSAEAVAQALAATDDKSWAAFTRRYRAEMNQPDASRALDLLAALPIAIDAEATVRLVDGLIALARKHGLTTYDACYLELAKRRGWPLATLDTKLRTACAAEGIAVL